MTVANYTSHNPLRIGTRRSPLALAQAEMAVSALQRTYGLDENAVVLVPMLSTGDKIQDRPLAEIGGKALWTKELERALIDDEIDVAVHSMKDVETVRSPLFRLSAMLPRADVHDRLIGASTLDDLPLNAKIGTSSPRRAAQLKALRPDLATSPIRGNVATRMAQVDAGEFDATLLAAAGLDRLGQNTVGTRLAIETMLPAAAQGAIGIDHLARREDLAMFLQAVNHRATFVAVTAERAFLAALNGNCHSPVAAYAVCDLYNITLRGEILLEDGSERQCGSIEFAVDDIHGPAKLAAQLLEKSSDSLRQLFAP